MSTPQQSSPVDPAHPLAAESLEKAVSEAILAIDTATDLAQLSKVRTQVQGGSSPLALANRAIGSLPGPERAAAGKAVGVARGQVGKALALAKERLEAERDARMLEQEAFDVTALVRRHKVGGRHPVQMMQRTMTDIMVGMGWEVEEGPEVEAEWFVFDALNFDEDHPARQMQDTFYIDPVDTGVVLRTHTSPVQARTMLSRGVPLYIVAPGKVYRTDDIDATHLPVFHQIEGLAVDKGITMAHLKGTLDHLATQLFGEGITTRLRPNYFPFTEPSAEMDLRCFACHGEDPGCRTCGGSGWIEWGGCGMVNRNVLLACGVDPDVYSGFAFGMGVERALMFRSGAADLREMIEGDMRFDAQFGMEI